MNGCDVLWLHCGMVKHRLTHVIRNTDQAFRLLRRMPEVRIALLDCLRAKKLWVVQILQIMHNGHQRYGRIRKERCRERAEQQIYLDIPGQAISSQQRVCRRLHLGHAATLYVGGLQHRECLVVFFGSQEHKLYLRGSLD